MLTLRFNTEDWLEALSATIDEVEAEVGCDFDMTFYAELADDLLREVLNRLGDAGVEYERAWRQSVGAFVIVQAGTDKDRQAFAEALVLAIDCIRPRVEDAVRQAATHDCNYIDS